jgi:hypothetical protein
MINMQLHAVIAAVHGTRAVRTDGKPVRGDRLPAVVTAAPETQQLLLPLPPQPRRHKRLKRQRRLQRCCCHITQICCCCRLLLLGFGCIFCRTLLCIYISICVVLQVLMHNKHYSSSSAVMIRVSVAHCSMS